MASEYDPLFSGSTGAADDADLDLVRERFAAASRPYLSSPWSWLVWSILLPLAALLSPFAAAAAGPPGLLGLWSTMILVGGLVEVLAARRRGAALGSSGLAGWSLRSQGNLSVVALLLSIALLLRSGGAVSLLPGLWLLLLGHSLFVFGGLAFAPLRRAGLVYQLGGAISLWPGIGSLGVFAFTTAVANLYVAVAVHRRQ